MHYGLVIVGHSLGAGTAAILSFLLRPQYPTLRCYAYSPPGGLLRSDRIHVHYSLPVSPSRSEAINRMMSYGLCNRTHMCPVFVFCSEDAMEYSKEFVTSVVLGKDLVPR